MNFLKFSIKSLFFLSFFTLIHPNNVCEAMLDSDDSSVEGEKPSSTTPLLLDRRRETSSASPGTGVFILRLPATPSLNVTTTNPNSSRRQTGLGTLLEEPDPNAIEIGDSSSEDDGPPVSRRRRDSSRQQDPNFSRDIPILNINPEKRERRQITGLIERLKANPRNVSLLREDISYETALVIYDLSRGVNLPPDDEEDLSSMQLTPWTNTAYFLDELDKKFFNHPISKKRIALILLGAIEGGLAPWGISPLVMYLGENVLNFIPVGGVASDVLVYGIISITTLPCMMQIGEFMNDIGNAIFDKNGFDTGKEGGKGPHIQKTDVVEIETSNQRCCHYIRIPTTFLSRIFSGVSGLFRALPMGLLWWDAETPFLEYRNTFLGPLLLFYLVKTYNESMEFYDVFSHQQATEPLPMVKEKKQILRERLKTLERCVNAEASDELVERLYPLIQGELRKKNLPEDVDSEEHISAFSALLVKLSHVRVFEGIQEGLDEHVYQHASLQPIVEEIGSLQVPGMAKLIRDIDNKRGKTGARNLFENLSTFVHGAATVGRFFITSWAVTTVLMYMGVDPTLALYLSFGAAVFDVVSRAIDEWYVQKETFLGLRDICSKKMAFWPARWTTNTLSFVSAAFFSIPGPAIIFKVMSDCPLYVRSAVALATLPSELSSFYKFFHDRFDRLISTVTTTVYVRTTSQKREWLNSRFKQAKRFIHRADQSTIEQIYNLTQEGL